MIRKIIRIDDEKCNGCGLCAQACHEGAIGMVDGKAKLLREDYCDGLGDCLPACPTDAISFEEREAPAYDAAAVEAAKAGKTPAPCGCPGTRSQEFIRSPHAEEAAAAQSELSQWPVQLKLVPVKAPYFQGANLLIAADCCAYSFGAFHAKFMKNRVTLIGCPKLDEGDYSDKLAEILRLNEIKSIRLVRMEVPCCGGLENALKEALKKSGKRIPWQVSVISTDGKLLSE